MLYSLLYPELPHSCVHWVFHNLLLEPAYWPDAVILQMTSKSKPVNTYITLVCSLFVVSVVWGLNLISGKYALPLRYIYPKIMFYPIHAYICLTHSMILVPK